VHGMDARTGDSGGRQPVYKRTNEARQGVVGHNVRYVLMISLGAAVLLLACSWLVFFFR
jgi:hypothetical protein